MGAAQPSVYARQDVPDVLTTDSAFVEDAKAAVDSLYNLKYPSARDHLTDWRSEHPKNPIWKFWDAMELWWRILPDLVDESLDHALFEQLDASVDAAERVLKKDPDHRDALLVKALGRGLLARQYANRERWFKSINQARHAISSLSALDQFENEIPDLLLGEGLMKYYTAYLPEAYPLTKTVIWMLPDGDKQEGLSLMKRAAEQSIYVRPEALYFLGKIYMNHENRYGQALPYFKKLFEQYPRNPYYATQYVRVLARSYRKNKALRMVDRLLSREQNPYRNVLKEELMSWKGRMLYEQDSLDQAQQALLSSYEIAQKANLPKGKNRPFHVMSAYYLGQVHEAKGDRQKALYYYRSIKDAEYGSHYQNEAKKRIQDLQ